MSAFDPKRTLSPPFLVVLGFAIKGYMSAAISSRSPLVQHLLQVRSLRVRNSRRYQRLDYSAAKHAIGLQGACANFVMA
jgi:hypothetical protein